MVFWAGGDRECVCQRSKFGYMSSGALQLRLYTQVHELWLAIQQLFESSRCCTWAAGAGNEYYLAAMLMFLCDRFMIIICNIISPTKYRCMAYGRRHAGISTSAALPQMQPRSPTWRRYAVCITLIFSTFPNSL